MGNTLFDFRPLSLTNGSYKFQDGDNVYSMNICGFVTDSRCPPGTAGACKSISAANFSNYFSLGAPSKLIQVEGDKFYLEYNDGFGEGCEGIRSSKIIISCNKDVPTGRIIAVREPFACRFEIYFETALACPAACQAIKDYALFDLSSLRRPRDGPFSFSSRRNNYLFNICDGISGSRCGNATVGVCQSSLYSANSLGQVDYSPSAEADGSFRFDLKGGNDSNCPGPRETTLIVKCNTNAVDLVVSSISETTQCRFSLIVESINACSSRAMVTRRDLSAGSLQVLQVSVWEAYSMGDVQIAFDLTPLGGSSGLEILQILIIGADMKVDYIGVDQNILELISRGLTQYSDDLLTLNLPTYILSKGDYLFLNFSSSVNGQIFSSLSQVGENSMEFGFRVPLIGAGILYSLPVFTPTDQFYYYCEADSGYPQVFITNFDDEVLHTNSVNSSLYLAGRVTMPSDKLDTIFFSVFAAGDTPIEVVSCSLLALVPAPGNVPAILGVSSVVYELSINANVDELILTSGEESEIYLSFVQRMEDLFLNPPVALGVGSLSYNLQNLSRADLCFARVFGKSFDFGVEAILYLTDSAPRFNSLRVSPDGKVQDLGYTYVFKLSADFNNDSSVLIDIISEFPEYLEFQFENGVSLSCGNNSLSGSSSSVRPNCTLNLPARLILTDEIRFKVGLRKDIASITLDLLVVAMQRIKIRQLGQTVRGVGEDYELNYFFTVPNDYRQYALLVETAGGSESYQITGVNTRTGELFTATKDIPRFGLVVLPGDLIEIIVLSDNRAYTIKLLNMSIPEMMIESPDQTMTTFDKGIFEMDLVVQPPARFFTPSLEYVQAIVLSALTDDPLWYQIFDQVFADFEQVVTWQPFGNRISLSLSFAFNETASNDYLCVRFEPPSTLIVPKTESTAPPFCWSCPKDSCGKYCGDCSSGQVCQNLVCQNTAAAASTNVPVPVPVPVNVVVPVSTPVLVPIPNPINVPVPVPVEVPIPTVVLVPNPVPVIVEVPVPVGGKSDSSITLISPLLCIIGALLA